MACAKPILNCPERVLAGVFTFVDIPTRIAAVDVATAVKTVAQTDMVICPVLRKRKRHRKRSANSS